MMKFLISTLLGKRVKFENLEFERLKTQLKNSIELIDSKTHEILN